jgi:hypothetical protein
MRGVFQDGCIRGLVHRGHARTVVLAWKPLQRKAGIVFGIRDLVRTTGAVGPVCGSASE